MLTATVAAGEENAMTGDLLIYGATGYAGKRITHAAVARGLRPILAGRDPEKLRVLAARFNLTWRACSLDDPQKLDEALSGIAAVLHVAGPFSATSRPMLDACLRTHAHYLDITGEIDVLEACAARDAESSRAGIMLLPGVGFDVVPSDCLAAHMKLRMPEAKQVTLAISITGGISRGTALTAIESIGQGTRVRRDGKIVSLVRPLRREIDFGRGPAPAVAMSWGDVATAYHSTGIADITVFFRRTGPVDVISGMGQWTRRLFSTAGGLALLRWLLRFLPEGPSDAERAAGRCILIGEAGDATGQVIRARLETPEGYSLTILTSLTIAERVIAGAAKPGFQTPSMAFGPDFILQIPGTQRIDL
jgi:short subunit dehydrogenase-like uncharacterized protein